MENVNRESKRKLGILIIVLLIVAMFVSMFSNYRQPARLEEACTSVTDGVVTDVRNTQSFFNKIMYINYKYEVDGHCYARSVCGDRDYIAVEKGSSYDVHYNPNLLYESYIGDIPPTKSVNVAGVALCLSVCGMIYLNVVRSNGKTK